MSVLRTRVIGPVMLPDGSAAPDGAKIIFTLTGWDKDGDSVVMAGPVEALVAGGEIDVNLHRTASGDLQTPYAVSFAYYNQAARKWISGDLGTIAISGAGPYELADLLAIPAPAPTMPDALAQALAAAAAAGMHAGAAEAAAANAALGTPYGFETVSSLLEDGVMGYAPPASVIVAHGQYILAGGYRYQVAAATATDQHVTTAGGVKLYALPSADGTLSLQAFGAVGDNMADDRDAILKAIDAANAYWPLGLLGGARIVSQPGARHLYSGRIRLRPGVTLDMGKGAQSALLIASDPTGGIEQVAGSGLRGELRTNSATFTGPMLELDASKSTELGFGRNERAAWFDVGIRADRQLGSRALVMRDPGGYDGGVAWVRGHAEIGECDYGVEMISEGSGYVNENWLDLSIYDAVESLRMTVASTGEVAQNRITLTAQTGANVRSGIVIRCDGRKNTIDLTSWDWMTARLNPAYDGTQVLLTAASGGNTLRGSASRALSVSGFSKPAVVDLAPGIRRNWVLLDDLRIHAPDLRAFFPNGYFNFTMTGDQDDELAFANKRWTVSVGGATPPALGNAEYLFTPDGRACSFTACTEGTVTVDFGSVKSGSDFNTIGLLFQNTAAKPQKVKVDFSTDGATWTTVLQAGYDGGEVPNILHRVDNGGFLNVRYIRLTVENDIAKTVQVARLFLSCHGTEKTGGAWLPKHRPSAYERVNVIRTFGGDGYYVDGTQVVTSRQAAIANASGGTEVATINAILTALRQHGLIAT